MRKLKNTFAVYYLQKKHCFMQTKPHFNLILLNKTTSVAINYITHTNLITSLI